jgi:hypothetical protein
MLREMCIKHHDRHMQASTQHPAQQHPSNQLGGCRACRYRTVVEEVPVGDYEVPLGKARTARAGTDITLVGWGSQVGTLHSQRTGHYRQRTGHYRLSSPPGIITSRSQFASQCDSHL